MKYATLAGTLAVAFCLMIVPVASADATGRATAMLGWYDCEQHVILHKDISEGAAAALAAHNGQLNTIFIFPDMSNLDVVDAIQTEGFNPLWQEVEVTWNVTPYLLCSDDQIFEAEMRGDVTLTTTGELESCPVVGPRG
jgi:hypothetical protein